MKNTISQLVAGRHLASEMVVTKASGPYLEGTEGETKTDFILGNLTQVAGHGACIDIERINATLKNMVNVGDQAHTHIPSLSKKLLKVAGKDSLRYTNSGSEAAHLAIRLARAATGRNKIVKFVGHYHGWFNEEINTWLNARVSTGVPESHLNEVINIEWNDKDAINAVFKEHGKTIAGVICEPCLAHAGTIPPMDGFLEHLRNKTRENGSLLIFDECITGFRVALGGAQEYYGIESDLVVYSKALSNGVPFGVVAGTEFAMEPVRNWEIFHASTYDSNPLSMTMAESVFDQLESTELLKRLEDNVNLFARELKSIFDKRRVDAVIQSCPGFLSVFFTDQPRIMNYKQSMQTDYVNYRKLVRYLCSHGLIVSEGELGNTDNERNWIGSWFLSSAHDQSVLNDILSVIDAGLQKMDSW